MKALQISIKKLDRLIKNSDKKDKSLMKTLNQIVEALKVCNQHKL
jgi:hypothetical protein